jgi:hypothetical protein
MVITTHFGGGPGVALDPVCTRDFSNKDELTDELQ